MKKKEAPSFVWHKRQGKMLSSKFLAAQGSPGASKKDAKDEDQDRAHLFLRSLKIQIKKALSVVIVIVLAISFSGCQPASSQPPFGIWQRLGVYVNGVLLHEKRATFIFEKARFRYFEGGCEMQGIVYYQKEAMILGVQESDCPIAKFGDKIYCGFDIDPDGKTLRLTRENRFNDSVREVYQLKGKR